MFKEPDSQPLFLTAASLAALGLVFFPGAAGRRVRFVARGVLKAGAIALMALLLGLCLDVATVPYQMTAEAPLWPVPMTFVLPVVAFALAAAHQCVVGWRSR